MMPFHFEQQPHLRPAAAANFRVNMTLYERISLYARAVACVVTIVVAIVMILQPPPTQLFAFDISMDKVRMVNLEAHPNPTNLTVDYDFSVRMSVIQVGQRFQFGFSNTSVGVLIGDGEWEISTPKSPLPTLETETPMKKRWTFKLTSTLVDDLDTKRIQHLKNMIHANEAVLITFVVSGKDFLSRDFKASCPAHIHPFTYKPPAIHACDLVIAA